MDSDQDWTLLLKDHPIFSLPKNLTGPTTSAQSALELSTNTLPRFKQVDSENDGPTPSGRRQAMILKDADLIVAAGKELRMTSLGDAKLSRSTRKSYKTLHTPNIQFEIHQIALNPSGKLLAVAGAFQIAVVVLPRSGFARLVPDAIDCKSVQIGQFFHATGNSAPIAKIDWHPWGEAGATLLVMTVDGKLREYDISVDTEEPQQVLSFVPERKFKSFVAEDQSEREVASFTLGKGRADWGPLTIYAVMKSGDIYSICPYMPQNASIPSSYVHSLECFVAAKQEFLAQGTSIATKNLSTLYDYQHKYITSLIKQLPPGTVFPAPSRSVLMHPPTTIKSQPMRQGPFLLQPSPRSLEYSEGGDATDITYLAFGTDDEDSEDGGAETEHLGVMMVAYQDGKVDVFLDVEKVEARWDIKHVSNRDLPMLAVYETIDLGLVSTLRGISTTPDESPILSLLDGNHPVFLTDPIHDDTLYVYHAFGVHSLHIGPLLQSLAVALREDDDEAETSLDSTLQKSAGTVVQPILTTFSVERRCSNPVVAVAIPNDVYLTYSIFIVTSAMRIEVFPLSLRSDSPRIQPKQIEINGTAVSSVEPSTWLLPMEGLKSYVSLLGTEAYKPPPVLSRTTGLPSNPKLSLPKDASGSKEFMLTPDTLRFIGTIVGKISSQIHEIQLAQKAAEARATLQQQELVRLCGKCKEMDDQIQQMKNVKATAMETRFKKIQEQQKSLLSRLDRTLQGLMEKASPELSEHETKWFEELKRMKEEIAGSTKYDEGSLAARTKLLEHEYERLLPGLKALLQKEKQRKDKVADSNRTLGFSQAFELGERSNLERTKISNIEKELSKLAAKVDLTLTRPPPALPAQ
ncbi:hypothetical protein BDQ12DRAFT_622288 [Crucibulum laeve]|uniref:Uncharacterized protein n=1 Tax=Crucibulum laeve TaxID=68775 RepID=A0A5C3MDS8_9AGAR|nr:hypothetical protein BDQ12DRAFT_622288 [Crucibulum laeve]